MLHVAIRAALIRALERWRLHSDWVHTHAPMHARMCTLRWFGLGRQLWSKKIFARILYSIRAQLYIHVYLSIYRALYGFLS